MTLESHLGLIENPGSRMVGHRAVDRAQGDQLELSLGDATAMGVVRNAPVAHALATEANRQARL